MAKLISIYQLKKNQKTVKFEFHYKFGIASPVTLMQKGLLYFKEEDNKKTKNPINTHKETQ